MQKLIVVGAVMAMAVGCGGGGGGGGSTAGGEAAYAGPIGSTDVAAGQARWAAACASCHENGAPAVANLGLTPARMRQQVREGSGQMPAIGPSRVSDADLESLLAYLVTVGAVADPNAAPAADPAASTTSATQ